MKIEQIKKDIVEGQQMLFTKDDVLRIIEEVATTYNESESIPLTEEILENNGFEKEKIYINKSVYHIGKSTIDGCPVYVCPNKERGLEIGYTDNYGYAEVILNCVYVDDMIKALRWCGFDDLANNIRI